MRYMFATDPEMAKKWAAETKDIKKLPEKKKKKGKYFKKEAFLGMPFNPVKLKGFLMRKPPVPPRPDMAKMFAVKHLSGNKFTNPIKPPALNPGAANKKWPVI